MNLIKALFFSMGLGLLSACGAPDRVAVQAPPVSEAIRIGFASVEVKDVSLPSYAAADEIAQLAPDGTVITSDVLWADAPERAIGLEISRNLARLTGRRVASEPWPFEQEAAAALDIRFGDLVAGTDGIYRATGQYFVAVYQGRERSGLFDLSVAFDPKGGPAAIARARGQLILNLTAEIARDGLR